MKKLATLSIAVIAASMIASAAYAADSIVQQRLADENAAYFQQMSKGSSVAAGSNYDLVTTPEQRNAQRDAAYWAGHTDTASAPSNAMTSVSRYPRQPITK